MPVWLSFSPSTPPLSLSLSVCLRLSVSLFLFFFAKPFLVAKISFFYNYVKTCLVSWHNAFSICMGLSYFISWHSVTDLCVSWLFQTLNAISFLSNATDYFSHMHESEVTHKKLTESLHNLASNLQPLGHV